MSAPNTPDPYGNDYTRPLHSPARPVPPHTLAYTDLDSTYNPYPHEPVGDQYPSAGETQYPEPVHDVPRAEPAGLGRKRSFDPGVDLPRFLGSAAATAAIAGILAYVGAVVIDAIASRWIGADYWIDHAIAQPAVDGVLWAWVAAAGAVIAAAVIWLLLKVTNMAGSFFTALTALAVLGYGLGALLNGPWQATIGPAVLGVIVILVIGTLTTGYTRMSVTSPDHY